MTRGDTPLRIDAALLRRHPLPPLRSDADKEVRGRVLVIGGSQAVPGGIMLAGVAALRAGAGKLQIGTVRTAALAIGIAVPEALVIGLPQTIDGEIGRPVARAFAESARNADALLIGPGMLSSRAAAVLLKALLTRLDHRITIILDSAAIPALRGLASLLPALRGRLVLTPHAGEMASLARVERDAVEREPGAIALRMAEKYGAVVVMKGAVTWVAAPGQPLRCCDHGDVGLATSGSGDVLAGVIAGPVWPQPRARPGRSG